MNDVKSVAVYPALLINSDAGPWAEGEAFRRGRLGSELGLEGLPVGQVHLLGHRRTQIHKVAIATVDRIPRNIFTPLKLSQVRAAYLSVRQAQRWSRVARRVSMARVLIPRAIKEIGLETTRQPLLVGHATRALARSALAMKLSNSRLEKVGADALDRGDVETALNDADVVTQTLGVGLGDLFKPLHLFCEATRMLAAAMASEGLKRLICVTGFGAGDNRAGIGSLQRVPFGAVFGRAYVDKGVQERLIKQSSLDRTIARPGVLTGGPRRRRYKVLDTASLWRNGIISRADVADFLVRRIEDPTYVRKAFVLVN